MTKDEITKAATTARAAAAAYYEQALADVDAEAAFWQDSVTSPLNTLSSSAIASAQADAMATLDSLDIEVT